MKHISRMIVGAILLALGIASHGTTVTWTNLSGGNWSDPDNWTPHQSPTNTDTVLITRAGTYTVTFDLTLSDQSSFFPTVTLGGGTTGIQTLLVSNSWLTFTNLLVTNGGVLSGPNANLGYYGLTGVKLTVNGGTVDCTNGFINDLLVLTNGGAVNSSNTTYYADALNHGTINSSGDTFQGSLTVASRGVLNQVGGAIAGYYLPGSLMVTAGGVVNLPDAGTPSTTTLWGPVTNAGTINLTNATLLIQNNAYFGNGGLINQAGGLIRLQDNASITASVGYPIYYYHGYFINEGAVVQTPDTDTTNSISTPVFDTSLGTITNFAGTLSLATLSTNLEGTFYAGSNAVIQLVGVDDGTSVTTAGTPLVIGGSGSVQLTAGILYYSNNVVPGLELAAGTLSLGSGFQGGTVTNLALDGMTLVSPVTVSGKFAATNSYLAGNVAVSGGGSAVITGATLGGTLSVANRATLTFNGALTQPVDVTAGGVLNLNGSVLLNAGLTNAGTVNLTNTVLALCYYPVAGKFGGIQNQSGGRINFSGGENSILPQEFSLGYEYFYNAGAITQDIPDDTNTISIPEFGIAQGTFTNLGGTLLVGNMQTNLAGTFYAAPGALIQLSGGTAALPLTPASSLVLAGGGQFQFIAGDLRLPANLIPNLDLEGGVLALGAGFQGGAITNLSLGSMVLTNVLPVTGRLTATNQNAIYGNLTVAASGSFTNGALLHGATIVASGGSMTAHNYPEVAGDGSLTLAAGSTFNIIGDGFTLFGPLTNGGTILISNLPSTFISGLSQYNDGTPTYRGSILNQSSGTITLASDGTMVSTFMQGYNFLVNQGRITKTAGNCTNNPISYVSADSMTNAGAITVQSGMLSLSPLTLLAGSSLNVVLGDATNYGRFDFWTNAILGGRFNATLANSFVPANGASFTPVSYASYTGGFASLSLPSAVSWQSHYGATNFTLVVGSAALQFLSAGQAGTNLVFTGVGGPPGSNYIILTTTNLALPLTNWTRFRTNVFDSSGHFGFTNAISPTRSRQFYLLKTK